MKNTINIDELLAAADARQGFPAGTMRSVMQQETGGNAKYLNDPSTYHYGLNADGRRVAGHTGKISTAFGPFGILESTGAQPGYGVSPLASKDLNEQIRFAADYLGARSKRAGGLRQGLAGYGEGGKYGAQVMARINSGAQTRRSEARARDVAPTVPALRLAQEQAVAQPFLAPPAVQAASVQDPWEVFNRMVAQDQVLTPVQPENLQYGQDQPQAQVLPSMFDAFAPRQRAPAMDFKNTPTVGALKAFKGFGGWGKA